MFTVASTQYAIEATLDWKRFTEKQITLAKQASEQQAKLLLLPEYAGIEIATGHAANDLTLFMQIQLMLPRYIAFFQQLAIDYQLYIQPGTLPVEASSRQFHNRAYLFGPKGDFGFQDKLQLTSGEQADGILQPSHTQTLFQTALGTLGIAICYDSEFPEYVRNLVQQGANLILVPSFTPSMHSFHRVFYACRARALENQCYVLTSCVVGSVPFWEGYDSLQGRANLFSPIDEGFPEDGILSQGQHNQVELIVGNVNYTKLDHVRTHGQVLNLFDSEKLITQQLRMITTTL